MEENTSSKSLLRQYWHDAVAYCAVFWSFGMCVAFLGPTLLDLGCITSSDLQSISWVFFAQLCCSLLGASLAGYLGDRCDANYLLLVATILIPCLMLVIPFCRMLATLAVVLAIMGINMGIVDCLANLQMIRTFGIAVAPYLHAMHFCYGLGAFVSPMIAEPFLLNEDCSPFIDNTTKEVITNGVVEPSIQDIQNDTSLPAHSLQEAQQMTELHYAFGIMATTQIPVPFLVLSLIIKNKSCCCKPRNERLLEPETTTSNTIQNVSVPNNNEYGAIEKSDSSSTDASARHLTVSRYHVITITVATAILLFIFDGLQSAYGGYVYSYAVRSIADLNRTEGAYLNALYWGMFALGRLLSIPLATRINPAYMLFCNIMGCLAAISLMLLMRHNNTMLYVGTSLFGMFLSSIAPTTISMAEHYIDVTSRITSAVLVAGAVGEMVCPVIVGNMFVLVGPVSFLGFAEIMCAASITAFSVLWMVGRTSPKQLAKGRKPPTFWSFGKCCPGAIQKQHTTTTEVGDMTNTPDEHVSNNNLGDKAGEKGETVEMADVKSGVGGPH